MHRNTLLALSVGLLIAGLPLIGGCATTDRQAASPAAMESPPGWAFDEAASDPEAIALADATLQAMGGRAAWDRTRYLAWNFFGRRSHVWDRYTGDVRIEWTDRETSQRYLVLMKIGTGDGRAWSDGTEITDLVELAALLRAGHLAWTNDSYWLIMPYKLKDPGVMLRALGEGVTEDGRAADMIELTFDKVGATPQNKYHVYIGRESRLVEQWDFYADASDDEPRLRSPWRNWQRYGRVMLSGDRGEGRVLTGIAVYDDLPASVFTDPGPVEIP
jgi:hypothetical protein